MLRRHRGGRRPPAPCGRVAGVWRGSSAGNATRGVLDSSRRLGPPPAPPGLAPLIAARAVVVGIARATKVAHRSGTFARVAFVLDGRAHTRSTAAPRGRPAPLTIVGFGSMLREEREKCIRGNGGKEWFDVTQIPHEMIRESSDAHVPSGVKRHA